MSSIYKKLDKIDDKESLSEKYNITSLQYFNKQRKLNEGRKVTVDAEGLMKNLPSLIKKIIDEQPYEITSHKLRGSIKKDVRYLVSYDFAGYLHLDLGNNARACSSIYDKTGVDVSLYLYSLPTNCELTEKLLEEKYKEHIIKAISSYVIPETHGDTLQELYKQKEKELFDAIKPLESKYKVTLNPYLYPGADKISRGETCVTDYVKILSVQGKLGQLQKQDSGYYEYEVDGDNYSTYLHYKEHNVSPCKYTELNEFDATWVAQETAKKLEELINSIDNLDALLQNQYKAEVELVRYISYLQSKYPDATISISREGWYQPQVFIVTYTDDNTEIKVDFWLDELVNSFDKVKKRIQSKIYRSIKPCNSTHSQNSDRVINLNFDKN